MLLLSACVAASPPSPELPFRLTLVAEVEGPTALVTPTAGPDGLYVAEQAGRVWRPVDGSAPTLVLDVRSRVRSGGELGLLGLAFAAGYPQDPRVFVNYTYESPKLRTRVASYVMNAEGTRLDPGSEVEVLSFAQPYPNHNGGALAIGPAGLLYIAIGDGGSGGDPHGHAQDLSDWLGSILRIDVRTVPYSVPLDNPFVVTGEGVGAPDTRDARPEIWAYGVRNPWGMHFDRDTLWFADVGQDRWEEVNRGVKGGNCQGPPHQTAVGAAKLIR